jgi:oligoribonuclease (3'-5' exoribonuclease)
MQLKMAVANKNEAMAFIDSIQAEREQSQEVAALIKQAKELQAQAESSGGQVKMPYEMLEYFEKIDIKHYHQSGLASAANKAKLPTSDSSNQADTKKIKTFDDSSQPDSDFAFGGTKSPAEGIKFTDD